MVQEHNLKGTYRTLDRYNGEIRSGTTDEKMPIEDGILATDGWTLIDDSQSYLFDNSDTNSDYRKLKALQDAGAAVPVVVEFGDKPSSSASGASSRIKAATRSGMLPK